MSVTDERKNPAASSSHAPTQSNHTAPNEKNAGSEKSKGSAADELLKYIDNPAIRKLIKENIRI